MAHPRVFFFDRAQNAEPFIYEVRCVFRPLFTGQYGGYNSMLAILTYLSLSIGQLQD
jgi:hypothetical protein